MDKVNIKDQSLRSKLDEVDFKKNVAIIEGFTEDKNDDSLELKVFVIIGNYRVDMFQWKSVAVDANTDEPISEPLKGKAGTLNGVIEEINEKLGELYYDIDWNSDVIVKPRTRKKLQDKEKYMKEEYNITDPSTINLYGVLDALSLGQNVRVNRNNYLLYDPKLDQVDYVADGEVEASFELSRDALKDLLS